MSLTDKQMIAKATASMLLEIEAVHVNAETPFILTSGAASPVYIDCRKLISFPRIRAALMDFGISVLAQDAGFEAFDSVAGGEAAGDSLCSIHGRTAGIAHAICPQKAKRVWPQCPNRRSSG